MKAHPSGFTCHKFGFPNSDPATDKARDLSNRVLTTKELIGVQKGFENCREAIGWDRDLMVHCHWEYDLRTSIQIADAVESSKPVWLEDPLPVDYSDSWKRLCAASKVPICMGENLARREGFKDFILNQGCDILHPDLRNSGGFLETKRIADMAHVFGLPMANHNTGSQVYTYAAAQWAASIRDYIGARNHHRRRRLDGSGAAARRTVHQGRLHPGDRQARTRHRVESGCRPRAPGAGRDVVGIAFEAWSGLLACRSS